MKVSRLIVILFAAVSLVLLSKFLPTAVELKPSVSPAIVPTDNLAFSDYVTKSKANSLKVLNQTRTDTDKYLGSYSNENAAAMRSPWEVLADAETCEGAAGKGKGFLLVHGLTDSPYLMTSVRDSLSNAYPCSMIRSVLLAGHGTIAGDQLEMTLDQWRKVVDYGINSFKNESEVTGLHLVGFSTGTSLFLDYLNRNPATGNNTPRKDKIEGLVLLSAAVKARSDLAYLSPILNYLLTWMGKFGEQDAARYESFSFNAASQFYQLTKNMVDPKYRPNLPLFMVVSADDTTVDTQAAREFFCYPSKAKRQTLLWYQSIDPKVNTGLEDKHQCEGIVEVSLKSLNSDSKTVNLAHTAISMSPDDKHYGRNGKYRHCKEHFGKEKEYKNCLDDNNDFIFGENKNLLDSLNKLGEKNFRRGTFNPDYENMMNRIICFVDENCSA